MTPKYLDPDDIIGEKYRIVRVIGQGGMGAVYEGKHTGTGRRVAVKVIHPQGPNGGDLLVQRFQREARTAGAIESQYIAQIFDTGVDERSGSPFLVMEYLTGEDANQTYRRLGPLSVDLALRIAAHSCIGLARAHEANVVHRDIEPANIFLANREDGEIVCKLLDFGVAKFTVDQDAAADQLTENGGLTQTGALLGSPLYMSPEQARGRREIDLRADIWSLGVTLYKLLSGRTPREKHGAPGGVGEVIMAICMTPPSTICDIAPWVPPEVDAILMRALQLEPNDRYQSANEFLDDIRPLLPNGFAITKSLLVRANHAEAVRVSLAPPAPPSLQPSPFGPISNNVSESSPGNKSVSSTLASQTESAANKPNITAGGVAATTANAAPGSKTPKWIALALGVGGLVGLGAYQMTRAPASGPAPAPAPVATTAVQEKPVAPAKPNAAPTSVLEVPAAPLPEAPVDQPAPSASTVSAAANTAATKTPPVTTATSKTAKSAPTTTTTATATSKTNPPDHVMDTNSFGDRK
ncbi:MAG TPA: serine/threonine-protein kinase [Polyangium sp.]|nr:serine/threonine-protein kinase [Polyangium sp.]